jgi:hypothetical protein
MTPAARPMPRIGAALSLVYPAYLNSEARSPFNVQRAVVPRWVLSHTAINDFAHPSASLI